MTARLGTQHRRLTVRCPSCEARVIAPVPEAARGTPFDPRLHAVATYLKTFQALSYERLQATLSYQSAWLRTHGFTGERQV